MTEDIKRLVEALEPFAQAADRYDENDTCDAVPDAEAVNDYGVNTSVRVEHFRRAREVLAPFTKETDHGED